LRARTRSVGRPADRPGSGAIRVRRRVEELGRSGGLILAPAYDLEVDVPLANIEVFFAACRPA